MMPAPFVNSLITGSLFLLPLSAAHANNVGENGAWQFETTADKVNRAYIEDMRLKKRNGMYAAPVYITNIDRQYNCNVSSLATGNQATSTSIANSPTTSGHSSSSIGNSNSNVVEVAGLSSKLASGAFQEVESEAFQKNRGKVKSYATGKVSTQVKGDAYQALNTDQLNSGDQTASVSGSNACQFWPLN